MTNISSSLSNCHNYVQEDCISIGWNNVVETITTKGCMIGEATTVRLKCKGYDTTTNVDLEEFTSQLILVGMSIDDIMVIFPMKSTPRKTMSSPKPNSSFCMFQSLFCSTLGWDSIE